ncbi:hypothetical protein BLA24_22500 [Streptomyces cinnamoneus]|uniref:Uncharacterized protein n=1 Tax=Streptomyces cinnamoneus TaxID=53446 RepID=A0A2G1XGJ3_STRCJ|nr:SpdD-like protein [Streptomyces cinnamoneus]PHQ50321.1 hypothetical protein BLA24_22500 [Streptomyces cinnamoneus]PPT12892.1 SpdD-like protein [Streptomyces cinnamoneus]
MLYPKVPTNPLPTPVVIPARDIQGDGCPEGSVTPIVCQHTVPPAAPAQRAVQLSAGGTVAAIGLGSVAVLVVGAVLVGMFLAIAITATSLAIVAVIARSMLNDLKR